MCSYLKCLDDITLAQALICVKQIDQFLIFLCLFKGSLRLYLDQEGAQWLSGRVLDSRPRGRGFEPHRRHFVVVLEQDAFILA